MRAFRHRDRTGEKTPVTHGNRHQNKRVFAKAQERAPTSRPVPYASVEPHTTFEHAEQQNVGTANPHSTAETRTPASSTNKATSSAQTGNDPEAAPALDTVTSAQDAEVQHTAPRRAQLHSLRITTPLRHKGWSRFLIKHDLLVKYPNIPHYIQHGADAGIPKITQTYIPPNCPSTIIHSSAFEEIVQREFDKDRYSGPFSREDVEQQIGPFQTSPLSMVPKAGKSGKFRLIQNLSFPRNHPTFRSINHALDSDAFPCTWGTFSTICTLVDNLPPGSQGACRDVAEAYRIIPLAPNQWPGLVVRLTESDKFGINKCNSFGSATAGGQRSNTSCHKTNKPEQVVYMAILLMRWPTSSEQKESALRANGLTTKPSSAYFEPTWKTTTRRESPSEKSSEKLEGGSNKVEGYGQGVDRCQMAESKNLMKTWISPSETWPQTKITDTPMTCRTSTAFPKNLESHGNVPKTLTSLLPSPSSVSSGTLRKRRSAYGQRRKSNISMRSKSGKNREHTPWRRLKNSTESFCMRLWLTQMEDPTSPAWKPCSEYFTTIRTCHVPHQDKFPQTSTGGLTNSPNQPSEEASQRHTRSMISLLSQMQVRPQALQSSSVHTGERGSSSQGGTPIRGTLDGPKLWGSNSSHEPSRNSTQPGGNTSRFTETTKGLSKGGKEVVAETLASMRFSNVLQNLREMRTSSSTQDTSGAPKTQQTIHPEADTHRNPSSYPPFNSPTNSAASSSTTTIIQMNVLSRMTSLDRRYRPYPNRHQTQQNEPGTSKKKTSSTLSPDASTKPKLRSNGTNFGQNRFGQQRAQMRATGTNTVGNYPPDLTPAPSPLRPHCPAKDRLRLWKPIATVKQTNGTDPPLLIADEERVREVLAAAYSDSTKATYGTGLLAFHVFCDKKGVDEQHRAPCGQSLLANFISILIGDYSAKAIENYTYGLRAWHVVHRIPWKINSTELQTLFASAAKNQPSESAKELRPPCTVEDITAIREKLNLKDPFDAAVFACLTTTFWAVARLGEFTVPRLDAFDPKIHVKRSNMNTNVTDRHGNIVTTIFIPWTKAAKSRGEELNWATQPQTRADPEEAMRNHLRINQFDDNTHLFQHQWKGSSRPMSRNVFLTRIRKALAAAKRENITGHSLRIGGTLEYMLRGIEFPVVQFKGRWASEKAFAGYLRQHGQILAPYMQANPELQNRFIRLAMPPVR